MVRKVRGQVRIALVRPANRCAHERDMSCLDGRVGPCHSHRDANVGLHQNRSIVDPVSDHGNTWPALG
jgi:hypothetical protein